jgi:2-amino-4-hydroxy-6-hydroxymethyldihydropteridine diphosphokinase
MAEIFLSLGSNQGDRLSALIKAIQLIDYRIGKVLDNSHLFESEPWGFTSLQPFYNVNLKIETIRTPKAVLSQILEIEKILGRLRSGKGYSDRIIDIDILFYGNQVINQKKLVIPHPNLHKRRFVLEPLVSLIPEFIHPTLLLSIKELFDNLDDSGEVSVVMEKNNFVELVKKSASVHLK